MGNSKLRRQLGKLLKKNGMGKLYTCPKRQAYKHLKSGRMRVMIEALAIKPGMITHDYGINQVVKKAPDFNCYDNGKGYVWGLPDQVEYESGYLSCGCGVCESYLYEQKPKSKDEIITNLKLGFENKDWGPSYLAIEYFELLKQGIDIITDDGFLVPNYQELVKDIDSIRLMNDWRNSMKDKDNAV